MSAEGKQVSEREYSGQKFQLTCRGDSCERDGGRRARRDSTPISLKLGAPSFIQLSAIKLTSTNTRKSDQENVALLHGLISNLPQGSLVHSCRCFERKSIVIQSIIYTACNRVRRVRSLSAVHTASTLLCFSLREEARINDFTLGIRKNTATTNLDWNRL